MIFRENEVFYTGGEVCLRSMSVPGVKFYNQSRELLCNVIMVLASQVSDPVTFDHEERSAPEEEKPLEVEEFSSRSTDQEVRQKEEAARNVDERKTVIKRGKIADESETWNLARAGASITFNLVAITKSLTITCSLWTPAALSPPIGSNELLVSNVIELSHDGPPDLEFMENASGSINVALLHSASNFKGYEVVIKQLVDPEYNEWEDLETRNIWHSSVNPTVPNWTCPSAEASCSKRWFSSFAAVWRLKSFVFPKPTSKTSEFICSLPDYPNVSVAIPWNSSPADTDFSLTLKVQEAPTIDHDVEGMFIGPILHISCSNNVTLSAPAKISLPLALTDGGIEPAELHSGQVKILHFNSREESQEWTEITDNLDMPVVLKGGIVTFHVKTFCRFWPWLLKTSASIPWKYASLLYDGIMKHQAGFLACLCKDSVPSRYVLNMFCFPPQLRSKVNSDMSSTYCVNMQGEGISKKPLSSGDETCVSLSNGFEVQGAGNVEKIVLKFHSEHHDHEFLRVSIKDPSDLQVDFLKLLGGEERNNFPIICKVPIIPRSPAQGHVPATFDPEEKSNDDLQSTKMLMPNNKAGKEEIYKDLGIVFQKSSDFHKARKKLADKEDATGDYEDNEKTLIKRGKLGGEENTWHLREAGASIKLNSGAVQQPLPFTCRCLLWNPRTLSPPLASDDILVSSVIELSHDGPPNLEYRESVEGLSFTVSLLHSAPNLEGYEVVIKQLTDQENNEWKELKTENTWHGSETSTVPRWLFPFAQAVCSKSGVSSFAAIWRPKSFTFSRGTAVGPELTCIVPDFPDVSVQIPQSCVPVNQDFCVTIQVQEFPSSKLKGEEGLVGPVLHISGTQNVTLIAPVTIRIPLTLCKGKQELAELCPGELRILHCESLVEPHDWKDITDGLDEPPLLLDGKVQFKVKHFSRFRPVKLTSRLMSASDFNAFARRIRRRSRPQYARFFTCLCKTSVPGHFGLRLFCYPQKLQHDVNQQISRCIVPYIGEGTSLRPVCEEEIIFVSLSETIIPQGSDEENALQFVRFRGNEVYDTGDEVCLGSVSVPKVRFNNQSQELLCNVTMVLASQVPVPFDHEEGTHILRDIYVVKDGEPSDCELEYLSKELGVKWKELGRRLKFNQATLASFDKANEELSEKSFQMLTAWKQKEGCEATYKVLYNALCHELVECKRLAEQFCCRKRS